MFLFAAAAAAQATPKVIERPYDCYLVSITNQNRHDWQATLQKDCESFQQRDFKLEHRDIPEGLQTLIGCLDLKSNGLQTYICCLVKNMPLNQLGPKELVMVMGAFTQEGCSIASHMGISRTFSSFCERRKACAANSVIPASIFMHVLAAQELLKIHPQLVYTFSVPLAKMMEIFRTHFGQLVAIGYKEQSEDLAKAFQFPKLSADDLHRIQWNKQELEKQKTSCVMSASFWQKDGSFMEEPQMIRFEMPEGTRQEFPQEKFAWLYEKPFYPSYGVLGRLYFVMRTEALAHYPIF